MVIILPASLINTVIVPAVMVTVITVVTIVPKTVVRNPKPARKVANAVEWIVKIHKNRRDISNINAVSGYVSHAPRAVYKIGRMSLVNDRNSAIPARIPAHPKGKIQYPVCSSGNI